MNSSHSALYIDPAHVAELDDDALDLAERKIAGHYMHKTPWIIIFWGLTNCLVWLMLWPLVLIADLSLWIAFPVATLCCTRESKSAVQIRRSDLLIKGYGTSA